MRDLKFKSWKVSNKRVHNNPCYNYVQWWKLTKWHRILTMVTTTILSILGPLYLKFAVKKHKTYLNKLKKWSWHTCSRSPYLGKIEQNSISNFKFKKVIWHFCLAIWKIRHTFWKKATFSCAAWNVFPINLSNWKVCTKL